MKIHAFILNWPRVTDKAQRLHESLMPMLWKVDVLNSDPAVNYPGWIPMGSESWGGAQFQMMADEFDDYADAALFLAADVSCDEWTELIEAACLHMKRLPIGIYTPNIDGPAWQFDVDKLDRIEGELYHVPETDGLCNFIRRDVIVEARKFPIPKSNKYGFHIDALYMALAYRINLWCVRDYGQTVSHEWTKGYDAGEAWKQGVHFTESLPADVRDDVFRILDSATAAQCTDVVRESRHERIERERINRRQ